jgi:large subunit ribosomal protein L21
MEYAIIELGGKQYRVEKGDSIVVDRLEAKEGAKVSPRPLLYRSSDASVIEGSDLDKVKVDAVVAEHLKGEKIRVFKYRPKKRYRRSAGHRSLLTRLEIRGMTGPGGNRAGSAERTEKASGSAKTTGAGKGAPPEAAKKKESPERQANDPARTPAAADKRSSKES